MKRIINIILIAAVAIFFTGCYKYGSQDRVISENSESVMSFAPSVEGTVSVTKGDMINYGNETPDRVALENTGLTDFLIAGWNNGVSEAFIPVWSNVHYFTTDLGAYDPLGRTIKRNMWCIESSGKIKEYFWYPDENKTFYAFANVPKENASMSFDEDGLPQSMNIYYEQPVEFASQKDVLVSYYSGKGETKITEEETKQTGTAALHFKHALTGVQLKMGEVVGTNSFEIEKVFISGIYKEGILHVVPAGGGSVSLSWTPVMDGDAISTISVEQTVTEKTPAKDALIGKPFMIIPQDFVTTPATIGLDIKADGRSTTIYFKLSENWNVDSKGAGVVHSFTIDYNGHEGIQLWADGPYWATKNIGAEKPEDFGWYFSWGNVRGLIPTEKNNNGTDASTTYECKWKFVDNDSELEGGFTDDNYPLQGDGCNLEVKSIPVNDTYDAAHKHCMPKGKWRIPTSSELQGLIANTDCVAITRNGVAGYLFKGKGDFAGRAIFLPAAGYGNGEYYLNNYDYYWSSSRNGESYDTDNTYELSLGQKEIVKDFSSRGRVIRPVENF